MITTAKICICDRCGAIERLYSEDNPPIGWVVSTVNPEVHFCRKCAPTPNNIFNAPTIPGITYKTPLTSFPQYDEMKVGDFPPGPTIEC